MQKYERLTKRAGWHKDIDLKDELGYSYIYQRLAELENAIEDGEIVRLPCPIGTKGYYVSTYKVKVGFLGKWKVKHKIIETPLCYEMLGANWFTEREKAEKWLKELKQKENGESN